MSQHHRKSKHTTHAPKVRAQIEPTLPRPCVECGGVVLPTDKWHVAHIRPASRGGRTTFANCGPAHAKCNLKAGGKLGAEVTNGARRAREHGEQGIRPW